MTPLEAFNRAIEVLGGQSALARLLGGGIRQSHVAYWLHVKGMLPAEHCLAVERALRNRGCGITKHDLRPDVYARPRGRKSPLPV